MNIRSFDEELAILMQSLTRFGVTVLQQIDAALLALGGTATVTDLGATLADLYAAVDAQVVRILALRSPVADDLRFVVATLKVAGSLRQTADHATAILERARGDASLASHPSLRALRLLGEDVRRMQQEVLHAFVVRDAEAALAIWHHDRQVDDLHSGLFRELLTYMMEDAKSIAACSELVFIAKDIERIGDQATNIAEMVHFLVYAAPIGGLRPKGGSAYDAIQTSAH